MERKNYMVPSGQKAGCNSSRVTIIRIATHKVWVIQTIELDKREITTETMILTKKDMATNLSWRDNVRLLLGIYYFVLLERTQTGLCIDACLSFFQWRNAPYSWKCYAFFVDVM